MKITTLFFLSLIFLSSGFLNKSFKLLYINTSNSLPQGLYLNLPVFELKKNDLVLICLNEEMAKFAKERNYIKKGDCPLNTAPLGKKITGIFNDKVIFKKDFILKACHDLNPEVSTDPLKLSLADLTAIFTRAKYLSVKEF